VPSTQNKFWTNASFAKTSFAKISLAKTSAFLLVAVTLSSPASNDDKQISVFSPVATYALPVQERSGRDYVGLLELLEPLGRVSTETNGPRLKLRYNAVEAEFIAGKTRAKIHGRDFDFANPFLIENNRGLIPLSSLGTLLPRFLGTPVSFHEVARRVFIGNTVVQPSFRLDPSPPAKLLLSFSAPVNPTISTEPGKLQMTFKRDPVVSPGSQSISFDSPVITHATYSESNGNAQLEVTATEPLIATFSNDRKTITISAVPPPAPAAQQTAQPVASAPANSAAATAAVSAPRRPLAVVDPAHGGDERGAALTDKLAEKDVTLGFARLLRHELESRGFAVNLLRDADTALSTDQRAAAANVGHAAIYIGLHATSEGNGARVYTALLPVEGESKGVFRAWNAAQTPVLPISRVVSSAIVAELQKKQFSAQASSASLRPLNNVTMPAVAVELAPGAEGLNDLNSANYQQRAAAAIADAVVAVRDRLGAQP
jgi:N-acetylmuramoyl-L-alanine amidase